jgi:predicted RNA-binding Zn ribbon-like protein
MAGWERPAPVGDVPAPLAVIRDFVNTTDHETGADDLTTTAQLTAFLYARTLMPRRTRSTPEELALARQLRQGMRRALELNHDGARSEIPMLAASLEQLPLRLEWDGDRSRLVPVGHGVCGALARIALAMHQAVSDGVWWRLKICADDECEWAYFDGSKNRARNWCEYGCGNRAKVRAYRARRRAAVAH